MKKKIALTLLIPSLFFILFLLYLFFNQGNLVYHPSDTDFSECSNFPKENQLTFNNTRAYFVDKSSTTLAIFYHGNAGSACNQPHIISLLEESNISYLIVEYAGFANDKKTKKPNKKSILQDVINTNNFVDQNKNKSNFKKIIILGQSLGTGPASYHASISQNQNLKLLLISPFDELANVAKKEYPFLPVKLLFKEDYNNLLSLQNFKGDLLIIHGNEDSLIPIGLAKNLFNNTPADKKEFLTIPHADHNNLFFFKDVKQKIREELKSE